MFEEADISKSVDDPNNLVIIVQGDEIVFRPPIESQMTDTQITMFTAVVRILNDDKMFIRKMVHWYLDNDIDLRYLTAPKDDE